MWCVYVCICVCVCVYGLVVESQCNAPRLLSEVEDVLGDRQEVTGDDLDKLKYTEQVWTC